MDALPREAMFAIFEHCNVIRFTCKRWYEWYDQWLVFDEDRLSAEICKIQCVYCLAGAPEIPSTAIKSCKLRIYSLLARAGPKWDWNREMIKHIGMIPILLKTSTTLQHNNLYHFVPDTAQTVMRCYANFRPTFEVTMKQLSCYPGVNPAVGRDRLDDLIAGTIVVHDSRMQPQTVPFVSDLHSIQVFPQPLVINDVMCYESLHNLQGELIGYLTEPSSTLSLLYAADNECEDIILLLALHPDVPAETRQKYFDKCWAMFTIGRSLNHSYILKRRAYAEKLGVVIPPGAIELRRRH